MVQGVINADGPDRWDPEPRWPAAIAVLAVLGLFLALPAALTIGPRWVFPSAIAVLLVPTVVSHRAGKHQLNRLLGFTVTGLVTVAMVASVCLLIAALPAHKESPTALLVSASSLWFTNILVFALWYWRLDAGGPHGRDLRAGHPDRRILIPPNDDATGDIDWGRRAEVVAKFSGLSFSCL
jgi:hypothetical protein